MCDLFKVQWSFLLAVMLRILFMLQIHNGVCFKKMEISDRINGIDRIRPNPVYPENPVRRFD
ncbi:MAG: hypothetical protein K8R19_07845 [Methanosarcinales archaeon]|nr:hypothetical protein [Methanosarcinales archaeon]